VRKNGRRRRDPQCGDRQLGFWFRPVSAARARGIVAGRATMTGFVFCIRGDTAASRCAIETAFRRKTRPALNNREKEGFPWLFAGGSRKSYAICQRGHSTGGRFFFRGCGLFFPPRYLEGSADGSEIPRVRVAVNRAAVRCFRWLGVRATSSLLARIGGESHPERLPLGGKISRILRPIHERQLWAF
jgi:hypothetical protein